MTSSFLSLCFFLFPVFFLHSFPALFEVEFKLVILKTHKQGGKWNGNKSNNESDDVATVLYEDCRTFLCPQQSGLVSFMVNQAGSFSITTIICYFPSIHAHIQEKIVVSITWSYLRWGCLSWNSYNSKEQI